MSPVEPSQDLIFTINGPENAALLKNTVPSRTAYGIFSQVIAMAWLLTCRIKSTVGRNFEVATGFGRLRQGEGPRRMHEDTPNLITSGLSGVVSRDGVTVDVQIYRLEREPVEWSLEVVNDAGTSIVWDDTFPSDKLAYEEFRRTVAEEGMRSFLENANIIPFRR